MRRSTAVSSMLAISVTSQRYQRAPPDQACGDGSTTVRPSRPERQSAPTALLTAVSHPVCAARMPAEPGCGGVPPSAPGPVRVPTCMVSTRCASVHAVGL